MIMWMGVLFSGSPDEEKGVEVEAVDEYLGVAARMAQASEREEQT